MKYWILSLPRPDMETCIKAGTFGLTRKYILGHVAVGDKVACYVTKEYKIIALGEVTQPYYIDVEPLFKAEGMFPDRIDFKAENLDPELDFMTLIDQMSFIKNLAYWSVYFRNGIVGISKDDWNKISQRSAKALHLSEAH